ncbi:hypothetical protein, partial [Natronococcus sp.]|uniref:hypothetical protein n=1 Tax=Natronococcus sp. TaxID=35747 RepID=UPI003A4DB567
MPGRTDPVEHGAVEVHLGELERQRAEIDRLAHEVADGGDPAVEPCHQRDRRDDTALQRQRARRDQAGLARTAVVAGEE